MSKTTLSNYVVDARTLRRQQQERERQLEEERRRLREERRRQRRRGHRAEVAEEREKLAALRQLRRAAGQMTRENPSDAGGIESGSQSFPHRQGDHAALEEARSTAQDLRERLAALPAELGDLLTSETEQVHRVLERVEKSEYDPFYLQRLKWARRQLEKGIQSVEETIKDTAKRAERADEMIDDLAARLDLVREEAVLTAQRERAGVLLSLIGELAGMDNEERAARVEDLASEVRDLYREFLHTQRRDGERELVLDQVCAVLSDMGYEVTHTPEEQLNEDSGGEARSLYFRSPRDGVVRLGCGLDGSLFSEFFRLPREHMDEDPAESCQQWCRDYDVLLHRMQRRGIQLQEHWREDPTAADYRTLEVSTDHTEKPDHVTREEEEREGRA